MAGQESVSDTQVQRPRGHGWGDLTARKAMFRIAESLRTVSGYHGCAIEVVRGDDVLEFVALATDDPDTQLEHEGDSSPLWVMFPALDGGIGVGALRFVRPEDLALEDLERLRPYSIVLDVETSDDPARWHPEDLLVAQVRDAGGRLRALVYFDLPHDGLRPTVATLTDLEQAIRPGLHAILVQIEREEFAQRIRLTSATRAVIRSASPQADLRELFGLVRSECREPFRAQGLWIDTLDAFDRELTRLPGGELNLDIGPALRMAMKSAIVAAWERQSVVIIEPDHVWGDDALDAQFRDELVPHVTKRGLSEIVLVPVGVGPAVLGVLAVARHALAPRWTDDESSAALEVAHDLGGAILNAHANERERVAADDLRRLDDHRRTLIDSVARELQNPLALVAGHLELLEAMDLPADAQRSVAPMIRNTARLTGLAQDLALVSRLADVTSPMSMATLDLAELTTEAIAAVTPQAEHREVSIELAVSGSCAVRGHPLELSRCIGGLLDNAVKYSHRGGRVEVELAGDGDVVALSVRDEGIGISSTDQELLFGEFFRSSDPAALARSGYGLGLSIVRQVALRHGGSVVVVSARGEGATFCVTLPRADEASLPATP
jgi:signal transduction histidine kinase